jgi:type II secretory pathway pseudopilin PulG
MRTTKSKSGVTFIEVLVSVLILIVAAVAIIQSYLLNVYFSRANDERTTAMAHLSNIVEAVISTPFSNIVVNFPDGDVDGPAGNNYAAIVGGYILKNEHITVDYVNPNSDPLEIIATLDWLNVKGMQQSIVLITKKTR